MVNHRPLMAPLFVPANRTDRIAKAAQSGTDAIIIDLEDAVSVHEKDAVRTGLKNERLSDVSVPIFLRINAKNTPWFIDDLDFAATSPAIQGIVLPKSESLEDIEHLARKLGEDFPIVALIETTRGLAALSDIVKAPNLSQLAFGSIDYALDLNCSESRDALSHARSEIVFLSRLASLPAPLDGVTVTLSDTSFLQDDCAYSLSLGFGGKLAIHPNQIPVIMDGFKPSPESVDWARRVLDAERDANGAAVQVDGRMIDRPIAEKARRLLASIE